MTTPVSTKNTASQNMRSTQEDSLQTNVMITPVINVSDDVDDQSQRGEEDLISELHQIIHMAMTKKGYKRRLEKM